MPANPLGANFADEGGHGSHVAGTIAGSRQSGVYDTATGAGLATRLSLFDTGPLDPEGRRVIPSGVEVNLLPVSITSAAAFVASQHGTSLSPISLHTPIVACRDAAASSKPGLWSPRQG